MQRIIQINIAGRIIPIEEDAYLIIKEYITVLERHFMGDEGREIIQDIENRIAELFTIRLQNGAPRHRPQRRRESDRHPGPCQRADRWCACYRHQPARTLCA